MDVAVKKSPQDQDQGHFHPYHTFLSQTELFKDFQPYEIEKVLSNSQVKQYTKKQILYLMGDQASCFFILLEGQVKLYRETHDGHEAVLAIRFPGETFGKEAIFGNATYPCHAETTQESTVIEIPSSFLQKMANTHDQYDELLLKLMRSNFQDISHLGLEAEHAALMTSAQRIGCFILRACKGQKEGPLTIELPCDKSLLASRLGMQPETLSRSLKQLKQVGVETNGPKITVQDIQKLSEHVCLRCSAIPEDCWYAK